MTTPSTSAETPEEGKQYLDCCENCGCDPGSSWVATTIMEGAAKRIASLERENAELKAINTELDKSVTKWRDAFFAVSDSVKQTQLDLSTSREGWKMHYDAQAETIKRYKSALELIQVKALLKPTDERSCEIWTEAKSALEGTNK